MVHDQVKWHSNYLLVYLTTIPELNLEKRKICVRAEICLDTGRKFYIALTAVKIIRDKDLNVK
jgi:hypothetical protein